MSRSTSNNAMNCSSISRLTTTRKRRVGFGTALEQGDDELDGTKKPNRPRRLMADRGPLTLLGVPIDSVGTAGGTELGPNVLRQLLGPERVRRRQRHQPQDPRTGAEQGQRLAGFRRHPWR